MSTPPPEFDRHAATYEADLQGSLPEALAEDRYFAEYKVRHVVRRLGAGARADLRVLDYGCGIGRSLGIFREFLPAAALWGYDPSPRSVERARQQSTGARLTGDLRELPVASFDIVFAANVFHHISAPERPAALAGCATLLREGGRIFLFEHNPLNPATRWVFERCPFDKGATMLARSEALALAAASGLRVARSDYTLFFPRPLAFLRSLEQVLGWLPLGAQYCLELAR